MQHAETPAHLSPIQPPYVRVGAHAGDDPLGLAQHGDGAEAIPQGGSLFKVQRFRRLLHFLLQLLGEGAVVAGENVGGLLDAPAVLRLIGAVRTAEAVALADVQVQARPLLADVPREFSGAGGELQRAAHGLYGQPRFPPPAEGAEIAGAVLLRPTGQREAGVVRPLVQPHKWVALVVF